MILSVLSREKEFVHIVLQKIIYQFGYISGFHLNAENMEIKNQSGVQFCHKVVIIRKAYSISIILDGNRHTLHSYFRTRHA